MVIIEKSNLDDGMAVSVNCGQPTVYICMKVNGLYSEEEPVKHGDDENKEKKTA